MSRGGVSAPPASNSGVSPCDCLAHRLGNAADQPDRTRRYGWDLEHAVGLAELDDPAALARATEGDTLLHCDLRADNMLLARGRVMVIDWSWFARGATWVDAAFLLPQLVLAGHTAAGAERLLAETVPAWRRPRRRG
ncbi:phosphotransferase [Kitasatospora sp. NPDC098652]|uniref:phosphotransferase n=1 Tax=Kitasatospora sp. NPDC098652 TaxID=3364095 RepID=UPI003818AB65